MRGDMPMPADWSEDLKRQFKKPNEWDFFTQPAGLIEEIVDGKRVYKPNPAAENQRWQTQSYMDMISNNPPQDWIDERIMNRTGLPKGGKPVYPLFFSPDHVALEDARPVAGIPIIVGLDAGRFPAATFCQCVNGEWKAFSELIGVDESASIFAPKVKRHLAVKYPGFDALFYGDPRGGDRRDNVETTSYDIFEANGMKVRAASSDNNTELRRSSVNTVLARRNGLKINPSCMTLKIGMAGGYQFKKTTQPGVADDDPKLNKNIYSHICEAFENAILGGGEGFAIVRNPNQHKATPSPIRRHKVNLRRTG
jgi:hypothetical protein